MVMAEVCRDDVEEESEDMEEVRRLCDGKDCDAGSVGAVGAVGVVAE